MANKTKPAGAGEVLNDFLQALDSWKDLNNNNGDGRTPRAIAASTVFPQEAEAARRLLTKIEQIGPEVVRLVHGCGGDSQLVSRWLDSQRSWHDDRYAQAIWPEVHRQVVHAGILLTGDGMQKGGPGPPNRKSRTTTKPKRTSEPTATELALINALTCHHQYERGSCLNYEPIRNNDLARNAGVNPGRASEFFSKHFDQNGKEGIKRYKEQCRDKNKLIGALQMLNNEPRPHLLNNYGHNPPGEGFREDD
jgi:hypothetical protein